MSLGPQDKEVSWDYVDGKVVCRGKENRSKIREPLFTVPPLSEGYLDFSHVLTMLWVVSPPRVDERRWRQGKERTGTGRGYSHRVCDRGYRT